MDIKSVTDVITNSSTEVFCFYSESTSETIYDYIKDIFTSIGIVDNPKDIFEVEMVYSVESIERFAEEKGISEDEVNTKDKEFIEFARILNENREYDSYPVYEGFKIKAKDKRCEPFANAIQKLGEGCLFTTQAIYS